MISPVISPDQPPTYEFTISTVDGGSCFDPILTDWLSENAVDHKVINHYSTVWISSLSSKTIILHNDADAAHFKLRFADDIMRHNESNYAITETYELLRKFAKSYKTPVITATQMKSLPNDWHSQFYLDTATAMDAPAIQIFKSR